MRPYSIADRFPFRIPVLLAEALFIGLIFGFLVMWADFMDETIFLVIAIAFLLIAGAFEFKFGSEGSQGTVVRSGGVDPVALLGQTFFERDTTGATQQAEFAQTGAVARRFAIDKRLSRNITKALCLAAVCMWILAEVELFSNPQVHQISQILFIAALVLLLPLVGMGFVQGMRHPKLSASRAFDASMNLAVLVLGIPTMVFFIFIGAALTLLIFVPQSSDLTQIVSAALLVAIVAMAAIQVYYVYSTLQRSAKYHGLSIPDYIAMRLSQEEKKRQKAERKVRGERIDELYDRIPEFKEEIRPSKSPAAELPIRLGMEEDYEYTSKDHLVKAILKAFLPGLVATFLGTMIYVAFFLILAQSVEF
ncbi:MAG: hypothetical protein ACXADX_09045 [Candidatus Hodarchaeales archaeon]|jgi:hypothetical protein